MQCEFCNQEHDGSFASGRFCSKQCSRKFTSRLANEKISQKWNLIRSQYDLNPNKCIECDSPLEHKFRNHKYCGMKCSNKFSNKGKFWAKEKICRRCDNIAKIGTLCAECSTAFHDPTTRLRLKSVEASPRSLLMKIREYRCEGDKCPVISEWNDKPLVLHLDHINGNRKDNSSENIRWLCPNCHSQTPTFGSKNIKYQIDRLSGIV